MIEQDEGATEAFDNAIKLYTAKERLGVQDRIVLAKTYASRAHRYFYPDRNPDQTEALLKKAVALREPLAKEQSALAGPITLQAGPPRPCDRKRYRSHHRREDEDAVRYEPADGPRCGGLRATA